MSAHMDRGPRWLEHDGKRILFTDYSNLSGQDLTDLLAHVEREVRSIVNSGAKEILAMRDMSNAVVGGEHLRMLTRLAREFDPHIKGSALFGTDGMKKYLLRFVNAMGGLKTKPFDTKDQAIEWLAGL